MSPVPDETVRSALRALGVAAAEVRPLGNAGGFSGARLWRVAASVGECCLRAWPAGRTVAELRAVHTLMRAACDAGLTFVPRPFAAAHLAGRAWDLTEWKPGVADFARHPSRQRIAAACAAVARLHEIWQPAIPVRRPCPAIERRLAAATAWRQRVAVGWRPMFAAGDPVTEPATAAWRRLPALIDAVPVLLAPFGDPVPVQPCLCDVWHDHVLFTGNAVTGLIDYGSVKLDNVAVDLARLLGDLAGGDEALWAAGLAAYRGRGDEALVRALDRTGVAIGLANWLTWLYHDGRSYADRAAVARRLTALLRRGAAGGGGPPPPPPTPPGGAPPPRSATVQQSRNDSRVTHREQPAEREQHLAIGPP